MQIKDTITQILYVLTLSVSSLSISVAQQIIEMEDLLTTVYVKSNVTKSAKYQKEVAQAGYSLFRAQLKPYIGLTASLPDYSKTFSPIIQPDGSVSFTSIRQSNNNISLFGSQVISATGGTIFISSDLQRFDDFSLDLTQYNGNPLRVGINQPLFGFNSWKYSAPIELLLLKESDLQYNIDIEEALGTTVNLYFEILIAKQSLEIAKTNQEVNEKLLVITKERLELGKVSRDEKLQLEIELNNAKLNVSQASFELERAIAELYTYVNDTAPTSQAEYVVPKLSEETLVDVAALLAEYKRNRPEILAYQRQKKEAERDLAQVKADYGFQAEVSASIGLARGADQLKEVYTDPFDQQRFNITMSLPILDWGQKKAAMKQVELRRKDLETNFEQQFSVLENDIRQRVYRYERLQSEIKLLQDIMEKAEERFTISNERYVLGNIDITFLTLAQREKDQAKRNYINALKAYWVTYYELRALSGYDILNKQSITY